MLASVISCLKYLLGIQKSWCFQFRLVEVFRPLSPLQLNHSTYHDFGLFLLLIGEGESEMFWERIINEFISLSIFWKPLEQIVVMILLGMAVDELRRIISFVAFALHSFVAYCPWGWLFNALNILKSVFWFFFIHFTFGLANILLTNRLSVKKHMWFTYFAHSLIKYLVKHC